jgi:hypothetical protein
MTMEGNNADGHGSRVKMRRQRMYDFLLCIPYDMLICCSDDEHKSDLLKEHTDNARNSQSQISRSR